MQREKCNHISSLSVQGLEFRPLESHRANTEALKATISTLYLALSKQLP